MKKLSAADLRPEEYDPEYHHRRQILWQIFVPAIVFLLLVLSVAVFTVFSATTNSESVTLWGQISAIGLIIPVLSAGFLVLIVNCLLIYLIARLLKILPVGMMLVRLRVFQAAFFIRSYSDKIIAPVLKVKGWQAGASTLKDRILR